MKTILSLHRVLALLLASLAIATDATAADQAVVGDTIPTADGNLVVQPINHATLALGWKGLTILVDPVGGADRFARLPAPDVILITDIHGDHLNTGTLESVAKARTKFVVPAAVAAKLPPAFTDRTTLLATNQSATVAGIQVQAIPAYNLTADRLQFHAPDRGVGYVLTLGGKRVYLSGDTEDIPEMRALKNIDVAFLCMNLPYTMTVDQAASAVRALRPAIVYPYHYRGSDLERFKTLVGTDAGVEVRLREWYPKP